jgi:hypothetical protein
MKNTKKIPLIFCVDVEPDERIIDTKEKASCDGNEALHDYMEDARSKLSDALDSEVNFTWFYRMDPQIERVYGSASYFLDQAKEQVTTYQQRGDKLGLHTHAYRWDDNQQTWIVDHGNQAWIDHCLDVSFDAFYKSTGEQCKIFRFGDRFLNQATVKKLNELGVKYEMSLEPGWPQQPALSLDEEFTGFLPNTEWVPERPFKLNPDNWTDLSGSGSSDMVAIPMSTGRGATEPLPQGLAKYKWFTRKILGMPHAPRQRFETLNIARPYPSTTKIFDELVASPTASPVAFVMRSSIPAKPDKKQNSDRFIQHILQHPKLKDFVVTTPENAMKTLGME